MEQEKIATFQYFDHILYLHVRQQVFWGSVSFLAACAATWPDFVTVSI